MAKGQKTIYKNGAVILRMVLGILTIVISVIVGFQSCAAGIGEAISEADSSSGAGGLFTGFFLLAAGIVAVAAKNKRRHYCSDHSVCTRRNFRFCKSEQKLWRSDRMGSAFRNFRSGTGNHSVLKGKEHFY